MKNLLLSLIILLAIASCQNKKENTVTPVTPPALPPVLSDTIKAPALPQTSPPASRAGKATVKVIVEFTYNGKAINANQIYQNEAKNDFRITALQFYLSYLTLRNADSSRTYTDSIIRLIGRQELASSFSYYITNADTGSYENVTFGIGVDSITNTSIARTGDLDPAQGMAWTWATGYKFMVFEGVFFNGGTSNSIEFHVGFNQNYKIINLKKANGTVLNTIQFTEGTNNILRIEVAVEKFFGQPNVIDFTTTQISHGDAGSAAMADNYARATNVFRVSNR